MPSPRNPAGLACCLTLLISAGHAQTSAEQRVLQLTNADRAQNHLAPLSWDPTLAAAARAHNLRILREPNSDRDLDRLQHQYRDEPDLVARASAAGARFSTVSENLAVANTSLPSIEDGWMHSPTHRHNLLNPALDHIGISVLAANGFLYVVQDFSTAVPTLSLLQVERSVAHALLDHGITLASLSDTARLACRSNNSSPEDPTRGTPRSVLQWDGPDVAATPAALPRVLLEQLSPARSSPFHTALVGACPTQQTGFSGYRIAVLLY